MGIKTSQHGIFNSKLSYKKVEHETYNSKVAMWQLPYDRNYLRYDKDKSKWFESINKNLDNEIEMVEKGMDMSLKRFIVYTKTVEYEDGTTQEISKYPNGNEVSVSHGDNHVFVNIKDRHKRQVAEKIYNYSSNEGRKILYKHLEKDGHVLTIVEVYSYDTTKNKSSDVVNYGYSSLPSTLTKGCELEKLYFLLDGEEVKANMNDNFEYIVKDKNNKKIVFTATDYTKHENLK